MTDFEKNTATEELEQLEQEPAGPDAGAGPGANKPERGSQESAQQPGFSQETRRTSAI